MGGLLDFVADVIGGALGLVYVFLRPIFGDSLNWLFQPIMNFLGFEDETIYTTEVIAVSIFDEDLYYNTQVRAALEYVRNNSGGVGFISTFAGVGDKQFGKFYRQAKWGLGDELPSGQINAVSMDSTQIEAVLSTLEEQTISIVSTYSIVPPDYVWCKYLLQENYNYDVGRDFLILSGTYYVYAGSTYNTSDNTFTVKLETVDEIAETTTQETKVTITNIDTTSDNQNTTITTVVQRIRTDTGDLIEEVRTVDSSIDVVILIDTGSDSFSVSFISSTTVTNLITSTDITVVNHSNNMQLVVQYIVNSRMKYWIYDLESNLYPNISSPVNRSTNFDMLPIVMLRNNKVDLASTPDSDRYKDTQELLSSVGLTIEMLTDGYSENPSINDIVDAFFLFGVSPSDTNPIVSRYLYELFDAIFDGSPPYNNRTQYSMAVKENPYNAAMGWIVNDNSIDEGNIGSIGTYTHTVGKYTYREVTYYVNETLQIDWISDDVAKLYKRDYYLIEKYENNEVTGEYIPDKWDGNNDGDYNDNTLFTRGDRNPNIRYYEFTWVEGLIIHEGDSPIPRPELGKVKEYIKTEYFEDKMNLVIKRQVNATEVHTIAVSNVKAFSIIRRGSYSGGKELLLDDKNLIIPLAWEAVNRLSTLDKTQLFGHSAHLVFYAVGVTELEWYETEDFSNALAIFSIVLTIAITIVSFGSLTGPTASLTSVLFNVLESVLIAVGVQLALYIIIEVVDDPYLKMALAAVVMVVGMYAGGMFDNMTGLTAVQLAQIPIMAADIYMNDVNITDLEALTDSVESFTTQYEDKAEQFESMLQDVNSGLGPTTMVDLTTKIEMFNSIGSTGTNNDINPFLLSPTQFFNMATSSSFNYDSLYTGMYDSSVHEFTSNKLRLGVI